MEAGRFGQVHPDCTCDKGRLGRLLPNKTNPCEWHFQLDSLAESKHSSRVRALEIDFDDISVSFAEGVERVRLASGSCRFFTSSFPQLATLTWRNRETMHANHLFSTSPFTPTLRSLTYMGRWGGMTMGVNNLTSFGYVGDGLNTTRVEDFRLFLLNNCSLESLDLDSVDFEGESIGPPACLSNLKSLSVGLADSTFPNIFRVPALLHLSSLKIGSEGDCHTLDATGEGIAFSARCFPGDIAKIWEDFTGYARPIIRHVHLDDNGPIDCDEYKDLTLVPVFSHAHTLEIGLRYLPDWYDRFLDDLKQLGPQLKTIRFAIPEELEPFVGDVEFRGDSALLDTIEDLVQYRFSQGRPLSVVERMVTNDNEGANREQDFVWRCLYNGRELGKYLDN